jgi:hypothetical protein
MLTTIYLDRRFAEHHLRDGSNQREGHTMSKFQRRHYVELADWLANASMAVGDLDRRLVAHSLADKLERDNPRFDRHRFLKAAGASSAVVDIREAAE